MNFKEYKAVATQIKELYFQMDKENNQFSIESGIKCVSSCGGVCCSNKDVAVPPVDLIPLAIQLIEDNDYLAYLAENKDQACLFFQNGRCSVYENRATLCRLFAFSSVYNKKGQKTLSICSFIKEESDTEVTQELINKAANIVDWSSKVTNLLPGWDNACRPFNEALKYALEKILNSYQYEEISL